MRALFYIIDALSMLITFILLAAILAAVVSASTFAIRLHREYCRATSPVINPIAAHRAIDWP